MRFCNVIGCGCITDCVKHKGNIIGLRGCVFDSKHIGPTTSSVNNGNKHSPIISIGYVGRRIVL